MYKIDNGEWKSMRYVEGYDPSYTALLYEWDTSEKLIEGRRGSNPVMSNHLWWGNISTKLEIGEHTIEVKATDMFGNKYRQTSSYRIEESSNN